MERWRRLGVACRRILASSASHRPISSRTSRRSFLSLVSSRLVVLRRELCNERRVAVRRFHQSWNAANWPKINAAVERLPLLLLSLKLCLVSSSLLASRHVSFRLFFSRSASHDRCDDHHRSGLSNIETTSLATQQTTTRLTAVVGVF